MQPGACNSDSDKRTRTLAASTDAAKRPRVHDDEANLKVNGDTGLKPADNSRRLPETSLHHALQVSDLAFAVAQAAGLATAAAAAVAGKAFSAHLQSTIPRLEATYSPRAFCLVGESPGGNVGLCCDDVNVGKWEEFLGRPGGSSGLSSGSAGAFLGGKFYVAGGSCLFDGVSSRLHCFDPTSRSWSSLPSMPTARQDCTAVAAWKKFYVFGGRQDSNDLDVNECYDPCASSWESLPSMTTSRSFWGSAAAFAHPKVYVLGGVADGTEKIFECYDLTVRRWEMLPPMRTARVGCSVAVCSGRIYVFGASDPPDEPIAAVECFDPSPSSWVSLPPMRIARRSSAAVAAFRKIYVFGGVTLDCNAAPVECLDCKLGTWKTLPEMPLCIQRGIVAVIAL